MLRSYTMKRLAQLVTLLAVIASLIGSFAPQSAHAADQQVDNSAPMSASIDQPADQQLDIAHYSACPGAQSTQVTWTGNFFNPTKPWETAYYNGQFTECGHVSYNTTQLWSWNPVACPKALSNGWLLGVPWYANCWATVVWIDG
ncbi:hypothetical protein HGA91_04825 [candidate division WWE3 bacterium]|nr:hypothetical protein [candidate division WWE3 bacterium]